MRGREEGEVRGGVREEVRGGGQRKGPHLLPSSWYDTQQLPNGCLQWELSQN